MRFCSSCKYFKIHNYKYNYKRRVVAGWWVGDGKCELERKDKRKYTVLESSCYYFEKRERTTKEMKRLEELEIEQEKREIEDLEKRAEKFKGLKLVKVNRGENKMKKLVINTITIQLWNNQEYGIYVRNENATVKEIVKHFLEIYSEYNTSDIQRVSVMFVSTK